MYPMNNGKITTIKDYTMNKYKVGERVAVYMAGNRHLGVITRLLEKENVEVKIDLIYVRVHEKQLRKLKKKTQRYFWVKELSPTSFLFSTDKPRNLNGWIKLKEVK